MTHDPFPHVLLRAAFALSLLLSASSLPAAPQSESFTYQGALQQAGAPANGLFDFSFALFDAASGGTRIGPVLDRTQVPVEGGVFQVELLFPGAFTGEARFLEIEIDGTRLAPRQRIASAPFAVHALSAARTIATPFAGARRIVGVIPPSEIGGTPSAISSVIGTDGQLFIAYYRQASLDLRLLRCVDVLCSQHSTITIDSVGDVGDFNAIALGAGERPALSYYDRTNGDLKFARCSDPQCSAVVTRTLDSLGDVGQFASITATAGSETADGPAIAYYDATSRDLRYLRCNDPDCTAPVGATIDSSGDVGSFARIVFDGGTPVIAYRDATVDRLKLAICNNDQCAAPTLRVLDTTAGSGSGISLAISAGGRPLVAHARAVSETTSTIALATCGSNTCATASVVHLSNASTARAPVVLLDGGEPQIWDGALRLITCEALDCSTHFRSRTIVAMNTIFSAQRGGSMMLAPSGRPMVVFQNGSGVNITLCANQSCSSHGR
jgi:hypothetical protein